MSNQIQFVFRDDVTPEQALKLTGDAVAALPSLVMQGFDAEAMQKPAESLQVQRWRQQGAPPTAIDLTIDGSIPAAFVSVLSRDERHAAAIAAKLEELLRTPSAAELAAIAALSPADGSALLRAALAAGSERDAGLERLIVDGLKSAERNRRATGIKAAALLAWPSLAPALSSAGARETDAELRRFFVIAARKCSTG
jgi:hypothetical protein